MSDLPSGSNTQGLHVMHEIIIIFSLHKYLAFSLECIRIKIAQTIEFSFHSKMIFGHENVDCCKGKFSHVLFDWFKFFFLATEKLKKK